MTNLDRLNELTDALPDLEALETYVGGPAVLFDDEADKTHVGVGAYRDRDIAMMRTFAVRGAVLSPHVHEDQHEWLGIIKGKLALKFTDTQETVVLTTHDVYHIVPGRPHTTEALEDTYAWSITIPPAAGYPSVQSCPVAAKLTIPC